MKKNNWLISSVLLMSVAGVLTLTPPAYVNCGDFHPNEFLDLDLACQPQVLPVLFQFLNTSPFHRATLKTLCFRQAYFLTTFMRC
jgi:hypothetical protein